MEPKSDSELLREYAECGAEAAFAEIVRRHTNLVYSAALRQVESPAAAAEITQNAFVALARGARSLLPRLGPEAALGGWLCRVARNLSLNFRRDEYRRQKREKEAVSPINSMAESTVEWEQLRPVLDEAMAELNEVDHDALVLRFFQNRDFRAVGVALGLTDDAAQKRVTRALDKLRHLLSRRGISTSLGTLSVLLASNGIQAAPAGLMAAILTATAMSGASLSTAALLAATKTLAMTTLQKSLVTATVTVLLGAGIYQAHKSVQLHREVQTLQKQDAELQRLIDQAQHEREAAEGRLANASGLTPAQMAELARLRGEARQLRQDARELAWRKNAGSTGTVAEEIRASLRSAELKANQLKHRLDARPELKIPEMALLNGKNWLDIVGLGRPFPPLKLETEEDCRAAFGMARTAAKEALAARLQPALQKYVGAHEGDLPTHLSQLQEYCGQPIGDEIFERYTMLKTGKARAVGGEYLVGEIAPPVDGECDSLIAFTMTGRMVQSASANRGVLRLRPPPVQWIGGRAVPTPSPSAD